MQRIYTKLPMQATVKRGEEERRGDGSANWKCYHDCCSAVADDVQSSPQLFHQHMDQLESERLGRPELKGLWKSDTVIGDAEGNAVLAGALGLDVHFTGAAPGEGIFQGV
jgi:hypothetical protein